MYINNWCALCLDSVSSVVASAMNFVCRYMGSKLALLI